MAELKDANTNPWYVLMTLYGEQEGDEVDEALAEKNRKVWNAWSCQGLNDEERARICANSEVEVAETRGWPKMKGEVSALHRVAMERRNGLGFSYPGVPDHNREVELISVDFYNVLALEKTIFTQGANFRFAEFRKLAHFPSATFMLGALFLTQRLRLTPIFASPSSLTSPASVL